tara:strand:+ start:3195 stop:4322 length:1128 start_codon:yes stop_codon:yes gene_type:complete
MKICYISNSAAPSQNASSLQIAKLCEEISKSGHKLVLILPDTGYHYKNFNNFYNIKSKYKIKKLKFFRKFPQGLNYYLYSIFSILVSNIKNQDLYITRNFLVSFILCILNKKHIIEIHDDIELEGRIIKFLIKYTKFLNNNSIIKLITTTRTLKRKYIKSHKVNKEKIIVLHNSSSLNASFKIYKKINKRLNIGYFGSIYQSRGIETILNLSIKDYKNNYIIFGGDKSQIKKIKKKYPNKNLYLKSHIPYSQIKNKLDKIDICILPYSKKITVSGNVGDISKYTSPLKIFDYMKTGKLIMCSNLPVLREVLIHNKNSIFLNMNINTEIWLKNINLIKQNLNKFNKIRLNAYKYANTFNINWRVNKILSFYHKLYR